MSDDNRSHALTEISLLFEISTKLSESLDLKAVLKPILRMTAEHLEIPRGTLTTLNRNRGEIAIKGAYGLRPEEQAKGKYHIDELRRSRGNMAKAARTLDLTERMIGLRVAKYGIDPGQFK